jgi:serine/threonine protein kinase
LVFEESPGKPLAKVADFGCSKFFAQNELSESYGGTIYWDAPECLEEAPDSLKPYALRTSRDIFSFGMIVVETIFERSSLEDVGWPVLASEKGSTGTIPAYLRIKRINDLKLSGEIASWAGTLFRERFHPANFELFPLDLSKNTTAPQPPPEDIPGTTLLKPAELEAEVRQGRVC